MGYPRKNNINVSLLILKYSKFLFLFREGLHCFLITFFLDCRSTFKSIWFWFFATWLISLSIMFSSSIHVVMKGGSSFFLSAIVFQNINVVQIFDPLIYQWALRLLPALGYYKLCCYEHWVHRFFWTGVSGFLGYNPSSGIAVSKGSSIFIFYEEIPYCFP